MQLFQLEEVLSSLISGLSAILGDQLEGAYLYGSRARGDNHPYSDIDVLIILNNEFDYDEMLNKTIELTAHLSLEFDVVISSAFVTQERFKKEMSPFLINVRREAIPL